MEKKAGRPRKIGTIRAYRFDLGVDVEIRNEAERLQVAPNKLINIILMEYLKKKKVLKPTYSFITKL